MDYVGKLRNDHEGVVGYHIFTVTMLNPAGLAQEFPRPVMVYYRGYGSKLWCLCHWLTNDDVRTNDYWPSFSRGERYAGTNR